MEKFNLIKRIQELYQNGENIIGHLKKLDQRQNNSIEDILISYDFQAGSYISGIAKNLEFHRKYTAAMANVMQLPVVNSILEIGVGEATVLGHVAQEFGKEKSYAGFDLSWSRIKYAKKYLDNLNVSAFLSTGDLFHCPFDDSSIDLVYTSHSIEPNGGREEEAIKELYRITNKYLVLFEPSFELADAQAKERMLANGYVTNLKTVIERLGLNLIEHRLFDYSKNPLNPTALFIIIKDKFAESKHKIQPACPITKSFLEERDDHFFSPSSLLSYPKIDSIPCLSPFNAVLTTKMDYE